MKGLASQALDRAEELKGINKIGALSINEPARPCKNLVIVTLCKFLFSLHSLLLVLVAGASGNCDVFFDTSSPPPPPL